MKIQSRPTTEPSVPTCTLKEVHAVVFNATLFRPREAAFIAATAALETLKYFGQINDAAIDNSIDGRFDVYVKLTTSSNFEPTTVYF